MQGETHVDRVGPGLLDVVADGGTGTRSEDEHDRVEAGGQRVGGHQVDHRLAVRADGSQGLAAAVAPGSARGEDDERKARPA